MTPFQESEIEEIPFRRTILPVKSIDQLVASFLVAETIAEIRDEYKRELELRAMGEIPNLEGNFSPEIISLYHEAANIVKYKPILIYSMKYALEDMLRYKFEESPSVVIAANTDSSHLQQAFGQAFKDLAKTNLFDHTINVFQEAINIAKKKGRPASMSISIVASLLHDFGKSELIRSELIGTASSKGYKAHAEVSASYVSEMLAVKLYNKFKEVPADTIETLSELVKKHHPTTQQDKKDTFISFIIEADHNARKREYRDLMSAKAKGEKY